MPEIPPYTYDFDWSELDEEHVATCREIPGLSGLGATRAQAVAALEEAISGWLEYLHDQGLEPPTPLPKQFEFSLRPIFEVCTDSWYTDAANGSVLGSASVVFRWRDDEQSDTDSALAA